MSNITLEQQERFKTIETLEQKYLNKYYHFLKSVEEEMLEGFKTKEIIKDDWLGFYKSGISDFSVGAERIIYSLMNGRSIGTPNSCPVGSDLFFEVKDAFVHLDLKTVGASLIDNSNLGDYTSSIFIGTNQNSYRGEMIVYKGTKKETTRLYKPNLPTFYNKNKNNEKICLSYFITILYDKDSLDILIISILSMPNGELEPHYKTKVLQAGKNTDKTRFRFIDTPDFEWLENNKKRIKVIYFNENMDQQYKAKVKFFEKLFHEQ